MGLTLTSLDTAFPDPDDATIARVLKSLDGGRDVLATLGHSEQTYVQASGSVGDGFTLDWQQGSLDRHRRCPVVLPLDRVTEFFQRYARGDETWTRDLTWEDVPWAPTRIPWYSTWVGYVVILVLLAALLWWWRGSP